MQRLIWTIIASFAITMVIAPFVITWLKKLKFGQTIYELGPQSHQKEQNDLAAAPKQDFFDFIPYRCHFHHLTFPRNKRGKHPPEWFRPERRRA